MKLSLKIYLTSVLSVSKEQLCGSLSLSFRILMASPENQQYGQNSFCVWVDFLFKS